MENKTELKYTNLCKYCMSPCPYYCCKSCFDAFESERLYADSDYEEENDAYDEEEYEDDEE